MARPTRICVPGIPLHIVQRGNDRQRCFRRRSDYVRYLGILAGSAERYDMEIHAYVLMTNHVHLLATPGQPQSASRMMQAIGSSYVRTFNRIHDRTGTLWEGRFRSSTVTDEHYLFACYRYIELNPVRAGIVRDPDDYPWSSFRANALGSSNAVIHPRPEWNALGEDRRQRCAAYRGLFETEVGEEIMGEIRTSLRTGSELGSE